MFEEKPAHRPRDAAATREAILQSARIAFTENGYANVGVREIAACAGVTAGLINRYFGTKEQLLNEVMFGPDDLFASALERDRANFGHYFAREVIDQHHTNPEYNPTLIFLKSLGQNEASPVFVEQIERWLQPLAVSLGGPDARLRAEMILATIAGFEIFHQIFRTTGIGDAEREQKIKTLGDALQAFVDPRQS